MGIANIINTAGGGGGGGSEIITNLVNSVDGAGLRLANQGYISCADVSANRFGTNDFSVEFVLSQETSAINADIFISNLNGSNQAVDAAVIRWDVIQNDNIQLVFTNSGATETAYNFGYDPAPDLNEPTHYLVSADRSGNAVLYRNGAEIASVSIAASSSANVGNSGQPTVIGSPVNNFGVKGNVYRLRTYSKALSSDEAKNVFDRADVPTALVSNLLLDLDCAYANPTQSTLIQDKGPNNQDGTLNGTITQTNVIKQLNSVSARIGTFAATAADGQILADGKSKTAPSYSFGHTTATGMYSPGANQIRFSTASTDRLTIDSSGNSTFSKDIIVESGTTDVAATFKSSDARAWVQFRDDSTTDTAVMVGAEGDDLKLRAGSNTRVTIDSTGLATFSNGIAFQSATTGSGTGVGYTLDSYEEGLWTPVIADASSGGNTGSGTTVQGYYTRIGNKVTVSGICTNIDTSGMTASNDLFIRGLPFQSGYASGTNANLGRASGSCVLDQFNIDASCYGVVPMVFAGETYFNLMEMQDANNDDVVLVSEVTSGSADLFFTITYFV